MTARNFDCFVYCCVASFEGMPFGECAPTRGWQVKERSSERGHPKIEIVGPGQPVLPVR